MLVVVGGVITGLAAGAAGQSVFYVVSGEEEVAQVGASFAANPHITPKDNGDMSPKNFSSDTCCKRCTYSGASVSANA